MRALFLNPAPAARDVARVAGCDRAVVVDRTLDPAMLALNRQGYLNGHTPFSAYLAFLAAACAVVYGHRKVIVSNERSCDEPAAHYLGGDVIHQYSKTYRFEALVAGYVRRHLARDARFWSLLRPLYELQVVKLFSAFPRQFGVFRSCNRGSRDNAWCGQCAKCLVDLHRPLSLRAGSGDPRDLRGGPVRAGRSRAARARARGAHRDAPARMRGSDRRDAGGLSPEPREGAGERRAAATGAGLVRG